MNRCKRYGALLIILLLAAGLLSCSSTSDDSYPPLQEALEALVSDSSVTVTVNELVSCKDNPFYYAFKPADTEPATGFVIYPGGKVDARSYAPTARAIAAEGFLTIIVGMPDDLSNNAPNRAAAVMDHYDEIETWAIGGHSMGGAYACRFARYFTWKVDGAVLWATWPSVLFRLDRTDLKVTSIYGSNDGYPDYIEDGERHLPDDAVFVRIEGGNHTQFGYYDTSPAPQQPHDGVAEISREDQQRQIVEATVALLEQL